MGCLKRHDVNIRKLVFDLFPYIDILALAFIQTKVVKMVEKYYVTYNEVHKLCQEAAPKILDEFKPNLTIAIGGGGYVPARILRSFLKQPGAPNIPIQAIGLSL